MRGDGLVVDPGSTHVIKVVDQIEISEEKDASAIKNNVQSQ